jgi:hypothetical protein
VCAIGVTYKSNHPLLIHTPRLSTAHYTEREKAAEEASWQEEDEDAFRWVCAVQI